MTQSGEHTKLCQSLCELIGALCNLNYVLNCFAVTQRRIRIQQLTGNPFQESDWDHSPRTGQGFQKQFRGTRTSSQTLLWSSGLGFVFYCPSWRSWQCCSHQTLLSVAANSSGAVPAHAGSAGMAGKGLQESQGREFRLGKLLSKVQAAGAKGPLQAVGTGKHRDPFH